MLELKLPSSFKPLSHTLRKDNVPYTLLYILN